MDILDAIIKFLSRDENKERPVLRRSVGALAPWEEREIEDEIAELRIEGKDDEADELQRQYDEQQAWDYDNEDDF